MMNTVLLTGAGFSANWGGRLAREVNTAVARRVGDDANLAALLHRNPNFEEALAELQNAAAISTPGAKEQLQRLEAGIVRRVRQHEPTSVSGYIFLPCRDRVDDPRVPGAF